MSCTCGSAAGEVCVACIGSSQGSGTQRGQGDVTGSVCKGAHAGSTPSETVTLPLGVPLADVTVKVTVTVWPTTDGSGRSLVIVVVVLAWLTVWAAPAEVLPAKFVLPA